MINKLIAGALLLFTITPITVQAKSINSLEDRIEQNMDRIEKKQEEQEALGKQKTDLNAEIEDIAVKIITLSQEVDELKSAISLKNSEIEKKEENIRDKEKEIRILEDSILAKEREIKVKEDELDMQKDMLSQRVRAAYISNPYQSILLTLFESTSIIDFLDRMYLIRKMTDADNEMIETIDKLLAELSVAKETLSDMKNTEESERQMLKADKIILEAKKEELLFQKSQLDRNMDDMQSLEAQKKESYRNLTSTEQHLAQQIGDIMAENEKLEEEIQFLIREAQRKAEEERKRKEEEARRKAAEEAARNNSPVPNTSPSIPSSTGYLRPVPGRITSPYGYRIHPIWGYKKFHYGIDYAGGTGSTIKATRSGTVIAAQYFASYGNTVIIDHGNGMSSLYAHLNSIEVSYGQTVSQGQRIAGVGSTGDSTGPHLHFEIRKNGSRVNPADYVN